MKLGIIGGSGLYELEGIEKLAGETITTPFGDPSDSFMCGVYHDLELVFLPRHGKGHRLLPSELPYRANIWGMKSLGVTHLISVSAVGSLQEQIAPGHLVFPDQFIDRTYLRDSTFFGNGIVAHIQFGDPVCAHMVEELSRLAAMLEVAHHRGGTYVCMEGPAFSSRAESQLYRSWGGAVIGMTNLQEAKLAREAEMCFATIALATDYDCWHVSEDEVSVEAILQIMSQNVVISKRLLAAFAQGFRPKDACSCQTALQNGLLTPIQNISGETRNALRPILHRVLAQEPDHS